MLTIPTLLTWLRIAMIPLFVGVYYFPHDTLAVSTKNIIGMWIFVGAALTDWLDGYLARKLNQTTPFGTFLDPVADKLMVAAALIVLAKLDRADPFLAFIIIGREITISALREWLAQVGQHKKVAVSMLGKIKTTAQMIAISCLLYWQDLWGLPIAKIGTVALVIAVALTLWSMFYYLRAAWPYVSPDTLPGSDKR
ncbi:MAG: CDP-diacylglycerol--glycerol-3-phosphate 3-phosphatidyltransferase [Pseudomonadota bacterium]|jgi:CDP-diacylglycerol--glycerol-3-phosphate 3-phosphatidyltransferase/cardiolipin synthase